MARPPVVLLQLAITLAIPASVLSAQERWRPSPDSPKASSDTTRGVISVVPTAAPAVVTDVTPPAAQANTSFYRAQREIPMGLNWGVGYDLNIRLALRERKIYTEDFDSGREILNQLSFIRYGIKGQVGRPYIKIGMLDTARLGFGQALAYYDNTPYGSPIVKRGLDAGMNFGRAGFELITGNLTRLEVVGARGYMKPLRGVARGNLGELQFGLSGATDFAPGAGYLETKLPRYARVRSGTVDGRRYPRPTMYGADVSMPLFRAEGTELLSYIDVARLKEGGHGGVLALQLSKRIRHSMLITKYEHREVSNGFRPGYFDGTYELERFKLKGLAGDPMQPVDTRFRTTLDALSGGPAAWIETRAVMPNLHFWSFFVRQYEDSKSGWLHLEMDTRTIIPRVSGKVWYDKWRVDGARDFITLNDRAAIQGAVAFRVVRNLHVFALRRWTFVPVHDAAGNVTRYARQPLAEQRISLRVPF